jgi:hypothetical protein
LGIILFNPLFVVPAGDIPHPVLIAEIPLHGLADAGFEGLGGFSTNLSDNLGGIDGVAAGVAEDFWFQQPGVMNFGGDFFHIF